MKSVSCKQKKNQKKIFKFFFSILNLKIPKAPKCAPKFAPKDNRNEVSWIITNDPAPMVCELANIACLKKAREIGNSYAV